MRSWNLREIPTPDGSRSPIVLHSEDEGRLVLIGLEPGQGLGDHQVKEHAFFLVVEGRALIEAGSDSIDAETGTLVLLEPDERRSISSPEGARLLVLFAPWPGEGHYRAEERAVG